MTTDTHYRGRLRIEIISYYHNNIIDNLTFAFLHYIYIY
jgi:hypothetical protein